MLVGSAGVVGAVGLGAVACASAARTTRRPPTNAGVSLRWWGNNAWEITFDTTTILIDPWVTRFHTGTYSPEGSDPNTPLSWNPDLVHRCFPKADTVLLTHGHFDHLTDVPLVAAHTGATVLGTESHLNMLRALRTTDGVQAPPDQLATVTGGELYQYPDFTVQVLRSVHSATGKRRQVPFPGTRPGPQPPAVRTISDLVDGGTLGYFLTIGDRFRIFALGTGNYIPEVVDGLRPDLAIVPTGGGSMPDYAKRLLDCLGHPRFVVPTHWDDFDLPLTEPAKDTGGLTTLRDAVSAASPATEFILLDHQQQHTF